MQFFTKKLIKKLVAFSLFTSASGLLFAASNPAATLVNSIGHGKIKIIKQFNSIGNLQGFIIQPTSGSKQKTIVYADKSGQYMIAGAVINKAGQNVAELDYNKYINAAIAPKVFASATKTNWVQDGKASAPHKAYILVEPNCIACHMLYKELSPLIKSGKLAVRWIFVAFMKPQSEGMAAAIIQSKDPSKAFAFDEKGFNVRTETGAIPPTKDISAASKKKLQQNMAFMTKYNFIGTPVLTYKTKSGSYQVLRGFLPGKALMEVVNSMSSSWN